MSVLHVISTLVMVTLGVGMYFRRRNAKLHWRIMSTAFALDLGLLIYIETSRGAVEQLPDARGLLWFHAGVSVAVLACYLAMFALGRGLLLNRQAPRRAHRNVGFTFLTLRSLNYVTSFLI